MESPGHSTLESMSQAQWYNRWTMNKFISYVRGDILEVGCGIGNFSMNLARLGRLWAIDIDKHGVERTQKLSSDTIHIGMGDIESGQYFFKRRKFDTIVCLNVLEHIQDDHRAIAHMHSLLSPGGHLVLLVPIYPALFGTIDKAIDHYRRYIPQEILSTLRQAKFQIVSKRKLNFVGALAWFLNGKILKRTSVSKRGIALFNRIAPWVLPLEDSMEPPFGTSILIVAQKKH